MSKQKTHPLKCKLCYRSFSSYAMLKRHYEEHTSSTRHCSNCGANYPSNGYHRC